MKLKLDENLGDRGAAILREAGHDVATVVQQALAGAPDRRLIDVCRSEGRGLVTLDLDFANPLIFPPADFPGIAVLRLPPRSSPSVLDTAVRTLAEALREATLRGRLWIVERDRIRQYQPEQ